MRLVARIGRCQVRPRVLAGAIALLLACQAAFPYRTIGFPDEDTQGNGRAIGSGTSMHRDDLPLSYVLGILQHIGRHFVVPPGQRCDTRCMIQLRILRDGTIENACLIQSTGSTELDHYAIDAIENARKLSPLPDSFAGDYTDREVTFDFSPLPPDPAPAPPEPQKKQTQPASLLFSAFIRACLQSMF